MGRPAHIGRTVIFTDSNGRDHDALVTTVFGDVGCNVVYVTEDETRTDTYGRQIMRDTSVLHRDSQPAGGMYWRHVDELRKKDPARSEAHAAAENAARETETIAPSDVGTMPDVILEPNA